MKNKFVLILLCSSIALAGTACSSGEKKSVDVVDADHLETQGSSEDSEFDQLKFDAENLPDGYKSVVYVSGSWYEMGYQYAAQVPEVVKMQAASGLAGNLAVYGDELPEKTEECMEHLEVKVPELIELYKGMADGAGIDYETFTQCMAEIPSDHETTAEDVEREEEGCSTVAAWGSATEQALTLVGADWDSMAGPNYYTPSVIAYPEEGNAFITECGWQGNLVMNEKGVICAGSSGQSAGEGDNAIGLPVMTAGFIVASRCDNAKDAVDEYINNALFSIYGENQSYHDMEGNHIVIEGSAAHYDTRESGDFDEKDYLITTNDFMTEEMLSSVLPEGSGYDDCRPRYWTEEKILTDSSGKASLKTIASAIGCTNYYADGKWYEDNWSLETGLNSPEPLSPFYQNVMKALACGETGSYYVMNGCSNTNVSLLPEASGCYVQMMIGENAYESSAMMRTTSNMLIYNAGAYIDHLDGDASELREYLDEAKAAQLIGDNYVSLAGCASEVPQQMKLYSKAASSYLKAQTYAQFAQEDLTAVLNY